MRLLAGAVAIAMVACSRPGPAAPTALDREVVAGDLGTRIDGLVTRYTEWGYAGTVLVARGDEVILHKGYGLADRAGAIPNTVDTRHPTLSITKPILATAILRLTERGALDLDAPLSTYLGPFPENKRAATLHHLLTHTAGLAVRGSDVGRSDRDAFVEAMKKAPFESAPGSERRYSNAGYSLAAAVVEVVTGRRWEDVVRAEVLVPAGMTATTFATDPEAPPTAVGYAGEVHASRPMTLADGPPSMAELWWGAAGAAGVDGTVADLYRWVRALADGELVTAASADRIFSPHIGDQGYGWHIDSAPDGSPRRWKGGGLPMYESKVAWYPEHDAFIVFAINNHFGWRVPLWLGLETLLLGGEVVPPPQPEGALSTVADLEGPHRLGDGSVFEIETAPNWALVTAENEDAAAALGFEGRRRTKGAVLATRPAADGALVGLHLLRGDTPIRVVELRRSRSADGTEGLEVKLAGGVTGWATRVH